MHRKYFQNLFNGRLFTFFFHNGNLKTRIKFKIPHRKSSYLPIFQLLIHNFGENFGLLVRRASKRAKNDPNLFFLQKLENSTDFHEETFSEKVGQFKNGLLKERR